MTGEQVRNICILDEQIEEFIETHISYVILTPDHAYKIKKAIQLSFLDFSTKQKRKYYCNEELKLNQRLAPKMYLQVVPVRKLKDDIMIGGREGAVADYAVQMKRMDNSLEMHRLLEKNAVTRQDIEAIAKILVDFHRTLPAIRKEFVPASFATVFHDIVSIRSLVRVEFEDHFTEIIDASINFSNQFIQTHHELLTSRITHGMIRDCHGDLHTRNIFLTEKPVIFDCIEFSPDFREIDILYELAFFCMDLEAEGQDSLSTYFMTTYVAMFPEVRKGSAEAKLFLYYKLCRANVRAKVTGLKITQADSETESQLLRDETRKYLNLMERYHNELQADKQTE